MWKKEQPYNNVKSFIAEGVNVKGNIQSRVSLRIDGAVEGDIDVQGDLIIGSSAALKGNVKGENIILAGKLEGNLTAKGKVEITSIGQLKGDISCSIFSLEEGGYLEGNTSMIRSKGGSETEKSPMTHAKS